MLKLDGVAGVGRPPSRAGGMAAFASAKEQRGFMRRSVPGMLYRSMAADGGLGNEEWSEEEPVWHQGDGYFRAEYIAPDDQPRFKVSYVPGGDTEPTKDAEADQA